MTRQTLDVHDLAEFDQHAAEATSMAGWFLQSVDLRERSAVLRRLDPAGAVFLGCRLDEADADSVRSRGALLFPPLPGLPFDPYRGGLYTATELYGLDGTATAAWTDSPDARIYAWWRDQGRVPDLAATLATSLHDHSIGDALDERLERLAAPAVGVMGGHAMTRDSAAYAEAVRLGRRLAQAGRVVLTGGGPGAMEAANLGARLADVGDRVPAAALERLTTAPTFVPSVDAWVAAAADVLRRWPDGGGLSLGIPTWFYGHEPPNLFGGGIAKYFANALREDVLLSRCRAGLVYLPGAAGTVQEIFQAGTENYYAAAGTEVAPLVLVGREHWTSRLPAWPLLQALGSGRTMATRLHLVDTVDEALAVLLGPD